MPQGASRQSLRFLTTKASSTYTISQKRQKVNADYIVEALSRWLASVKKKRPMMAVRDWSFLWNSAKVHTAAVVTEWMVVKALRVTEHRPLVAGPSSGRLFLFPTVKKQLSGMTLTQESFKSIWEGPPGVLLERTSPLPFGGGTIENITPFFKAV